MSTTLVDDYATVSTSMRKAESDSRAKFLSDVIKLAHSADGSQEAAVKLSDFMSNLSEEELADLTLQTSVAGPLAHLLSKLLHSNNSNVLLYTARTLKLMMRDDSSREGLNKAGVSKAIAGTLHGLVKSSLKDSASVSLSTETMKELYAAVQSLLFDTASATEFASGGGLRVIGDTLNGLFLSNDVEKGSSRSVAKGKADPELAAVVLASACNALSFCDTSLAVYIHEMRGWIPAICETLLHSVVHDQDMTTFYAVCCLANATRDPGLTHALRAANGAEALDRHRHAGPKTSEVTTVALNRLQITSAGKRDTEKVWRFRWGGGKGLAKGRALDVLGVIAFLFVVSAIAGIIVLTVLHSTTF